MNLRQTITAFAFDLLFVSGLVIVAFLTLDAVFA